MKRTLLLGIIGIIALMAICSTIVYAFLPPTSHPHFDIIVESDSHFARAGHSYSLGMTNLGGVVETLPSPWGVDSIHWFVPTFAIDTYISGSNIRYGINFSIPSSASFEEFAPVKLGLQVHNCLDTSDKGWVYSFTSYKTLDATSTYSTSKTFTVLPWKLVTLQFHNSGTMDTDDPINPNVVPTNPSMDTALGSIQYDLIGAHYAGNRMEIAGTISPSIATCLGGFNFTQEVRTFAYHTGVLYINDEDHLHSSNTTWHPDVTLISMGAPFNSPPVNSKIFLYDVPALPLSSTTINGDKWERKQDFRTFATQDGDLASDTILWHNDITATWDSTSSKWNVQYDCNTSNIMP